MNSPTLVRCAGWRCAFSLGVALLRVKAGGFPGEIQRPGRRLRQWLATGALILSILLCGGRTAVLAATDGSRSDEPKPLDAWDEADFAAALNDPSWRTRAVAAYKLHEHSRPFSDPKLLEIIGNRLKDKEDPPNPYLAAIPYTGPAARTIAPSVAAFLEHRDPSVRVLALRALASIGKGAREFAPQVVELLKKEDANGCAFALRTLGRMEASEFAPQVAAFLHDEGYQLQSCALEALGRMGAKGYGPGFMAALKSTTWDVEWAAIEAFGSLGDKAQKFVPEIVALIKDPAVTGKYAASEARGVRKNAKGSLIRMGEAARDAAPLLMALLKDPNPHVSDTAAQTLVEMGEAARDLAPQLAAFLKSDDSKSRIFAIRVLANMPETALEFTPQITAQLRGEFDYVSGPAVEALAKLSRTQKGVVPQVAALLLEPNLHTQSTALHALATMGATAKEFAPQVAAYLKHQDEFMSTRALWALGEIGEGASEFAPQVAAFLENEDYTVRCTAARALGSMGRGAERFAPHLAAHLDDENALVRADAREALSRLGVIAPQAVRFLDRGNGKFRARAIAALKAMQDGPEGVMLLMSDLLKDPDPEVRRDTVRALEWLGESAKELFPQVTALLSDKDRGVRGAVGDFFGRQRRIPGVMLQALSAAHDYPDEKGGFQLIAYRHRADPGDARCIAWLGNRTPEELPHYRDFDKNETKLAVDALRRVLPVSKEADRFRKLTAEAAGNIAVLTKYRKWDAEDIPWLESVGARLKACGQNEHAIAVAEVLTITKGLR